MRAYIDEHIGFVRLAELLKQSGVPLSGAVFDIIFDLALISSSYAAVTAMPASLTVEHEAFLAVPIPAAVQSTVQRLVHRLATSPQWT